MLSAPLRDLAVVTGEENLGDFHAAKIFGAGVLRELEVVAVREGLDFGGSFAAEDAVDEANDAVDDDQRREFAAG